MRTYHKLASTATKPNARSTSNERSSERSFTQRAVLKAGAFSKMKAQQIPFGQQDPIMNQFSYAQLAQQRQTTQQQFTRENYANKLRSEDRLAQLQQSQRYKTPPTKYTQVRSRLHQELASIEQLHSPGNAYGYGQIHADGASLPLQTQGYIKTQPAYAEEQNLLSTSSANPLLFQPGRFSHLNAASVQAPLEDIYELKGRISSVN